MVVEQKRVQIERFPYILGVELEGGLPFSWKLGGDIGLDEAEVVELCAVRRRCPIMVHR